MADKKTEAPILIAPEVLEAAIRDVVASELSHRRPGAAFESEEDRIAREALAAEPVLDTKPFPHTGEPPDARSPEANLASRSNIVASGPGTVADFV